MSERQRQLEAVIAGAIRDGALLKMEPQGTTKLVLDRLVSAQFSVMDTAGAVAHAAPPIPAVIRVHGSGAPLDGWSTKPRRATANAERFAAHAHCAQRYGDHPYAFHLGKVVDVLVDAGIVDGDLLDAAWLHDVVEDTGVNISEVRDQFGEKVAKIVWACSGFGENRRARNADIAQKLAAYPPAIPVKVADRIANLENALVEAPRLVPMYLAEHDAFMELVQRSGACPLVLAQRLEHARAAALRTTALT